MYLAEEKMGHLSLSQWSDSSLYSAQKKIMTGIERVCELMPGPTANLCKQEVEKMFPLAINFVTAILVSLRNQRLDEAFSLSFISSLKQQQECVWCCREVGKHTFSSTETSRGLQTPRALQLLW